VELTAGVPSLRTFYVYLTSGCNCVCRHCWIVPEASATNLMLSPDLLRRAIRQALPLGLQSVKWTGGEPTLRRDLVPLVEAMASTPGITEVSMTTNALRLRELAQPLAAAGSPVARATAAIARNASASARPISAASASGSAKLRRSCTLTATRTW